MNQKIIGNRPLLIWGAFGAIVLDQFITGLFIKSISTEFLIGTAVSLLGCYIGLLGIKHIGWWQKIIPLIGFVLCGLSVFGLAFVYIFFRNFTF